MSKHGISASINSDWRCPDGNRNVGGVDGSQHTQGTAGDFDAPNFDEDMWIQFEAAAMEVAGASATSGFEGGKPENRRNNWNYRGYIHIDWR